MLNSADIAQLTRLYHLGGYDPTRAAESIAEEVDTLHGCNSVGLLYIAANERYHGNGALIPGWKRYLCQRELDSREVQHG